MSESAARYRALQAERELRRLRRENQQLCADRDRALGARDRARRKERQLRERVAVLIDQMQALVR